MPTQPRKTATKATKKAEPTPKRKRTAPTSPAAPQPVAGEDKYMPTAWGGGGSSGPQDLEMPSGQIALVRRPGLQQLMIEGVLHKMDNLTALVDKKYIRKAGPQAKASDAIDVGGLLGDPQAMAEIMHNVDRVTCAVVIRPQVAMTPSDPTNRVPGVIYCDSISIEDRMFIFNYAIGASKDLESFRRESEAVVGSLAAGEPVASEAE